MSEPQMDMAILELPDSMRDIARIIGVEATRKLMAHWGGYMSFYVPRKIAGHHPLVQVLGLEAAQKLAGEYGGDYLRNIPRQAISRREARDTAILRRKEEGARACDIAQEFGMTERNVWRILAQCRGASLPAQGGSTC